MPVTLADRLQGKAANLIRVRRGDDGARRPRRILPAGRKTLRQGGGS